MTEKKPGETTCDLCREVFPTDHMFEFHVYELCPDCYEHVLVFGMGADEIVIVNDQDD